MRGMNSACIDLIYLDPPFNSNANYAAPVGSKAAGAEFKDTWGLDDLKTAWHALIQHEHPELYQYLKAVLAMNGKSMMAYLIYMAVRIMEMKRLLKPTGSIYLHCDPYASHYLKLLLDCILGRKHFRNEIVWCYSGPSQARNWFPRQHDVLLFYAMQTKQPFYRENIRIPHKNGLHNAGGTMYGKDYGSVDTTMLECKGKLCPDWWSDIGSGAHISSFERVGYPTQKPIALLERVIKASSSEGDVVLDPFCGCATACIAAEMLGRQWTGIDISPKTVELVQLRMHREVGLFYQGEHRMEPPLRTDIEPIRRYNHPENKQHLYGKQSGNCNGCHDHFEARHLEIDHIVPRSKAGTDHLENLQLLCGSCNRIKGNRSQEYLSAALNHSSLVKLVA